MDNSAIFLVVAALLFVVFMGVALVTNKTRKLRIFLADNSSIEVTRKWNDGMNDIKNMKVYHQGDKLVWLANHWVIKIEEM